jgi:capsular exopolysaccharide synthesis family protein
MIIGEEFEPSIERPFHLEVQTMDIKDFLALMWRNVIYIILGLVLGACAGLIVSIIQTPVYEATTRVFIGRASPQSNEGMLLLDDEQLMSINLQLTKSQAVLNEVSSQLGSEIDQGNIQVTVIPNTQILKINVRDPDPQRAATITNLIVQTLIQKNEELLSGRFAAYEDATTKQIDGVQKQINDLQSQINQSTDTNVQEQLGQVNQQMEELQTKISSLEQEIAGFPNTPSPRQLISIAEINAQLDQLHSLMVLYQEVQTNLAYLGAPGQNSSSLEHPRLKTLQSTFDLYQQINATLLDSRENARLLRTQSGQNIIQIVVAVPPPLGYPILPMPSLYIALGGFVGMALAIVAILIIDHMDNSLKSAGQIEELLGLPVLGFVPANSLIKNNLATLHDPYSAEAEAYRALGAGLAISGTGKNIFTLMVVNSEPKDARTNIAANLAVINAQQGKQVILLDGDLKHPHLHTLFGMENQKGFSELLNGRMDIKSARRVVKGVEGLTLISSGASEKESTAWLDSEKWEQLLSELQKQADLVIVDSPPAAVADAQILASKTNAVLLAIRSGHTRIDSAQAVLRRFQLIGIGSTRVMGAVLINRTTNPWALLLAKLKLHKKEEAPGIHSETDEAPISLS